MTTFPIGFNKKNSPNLKTLLTPILYYAVIKKIKGRGGDVNHVAPRARGPDPWRDGGGKWRITWVCTFLAESEPSEHLWIFFVEKDYFCQKEVMENIIQTVFLYWNLTLQKKLFFSYLGSRSSYLPIFAA